jgi:exonuclease SbcC
MKPIYLEIQAFGPFVERQAIDFEQLYQNQIFLIHGPTGAGKSTLFDAICVALYDESSGLRKVEQMRSHYADKQKNTEVRFVFEVKGKCYEAYRALELSKKGTLEKKQRFALVAKNPLTGQYEAQEKPITKVKDIEEQVKQLIGFDEKQFKQIIILPQGKFQELLLASSQEKEKTLEQLFDTQLYKNLTERLKAEVNKRKIELAEIKNLLDAQGSTLPEEARDHQQAYIDQEKEALKALREALEKLKKQKEQAEKELQEAENLSEHYLRKREKAALLQAHLQEEQAYQTKIQRLGRAERAAPLQSSVGELSFIENDLGTKQKELAEKQSALLGIVEEESRIKTEEEALKAQAATMQQKADTKKGLETFMPKLRQRRQLEEEQLKVKENLQGLAQAQALKQETLQKNEEALVQARQEYEKLGDLILQQEKVKVRLTEAQSKLAQKERYEALLAQYKAQKKAAETLQKSESQAAAHYQKLHQALLQMEAQWRKNQAAILGQQLVAGRPCPVCGALEHPAPAQATEENLVNEAELDKQREQKDQAEQEKNTLQKQLAKANEDLVSTESEGKAIAEALGEDWKKKSLQEIEAAIKEDKEAAESLRKKIAICEGLKEQIQTKEAFAEALRQEIEAIRASTQDQERRQISIYSDLKNLLAENQYPLVDEAALQMQVASLQAEISQYEQRLNQNQKNIRQNFEKKTELQAQIQSLTERIQALTQSAQERREQIGQALLVKGFDSLEALQEALLNEEETESLRRETAAWEKEKEKLATEIEQLNSYIKGREEPPLQALQENLTALKKQYEEGGEQQISRQTKLQQIENTARIIAEKEAERKQKEEEYAHYELLRRSAVGEGGLKQSLTAYILGAFLEEVLYYTNKRLARLSQGRYELFLTDEIEDGRKKSGLDFEVLDNYNGQKRPVKTLSGGEIFFSSLALALGMTDAVSARSGGIRLEAMFIDEGFGSLDSETLDLAINTLLDLEGAHRLIGIISHVSELKERILGARIEVRKSKQGSSLRLA